MAGTELGHSGSVGSEEGRFGTIDGLRCGLEDRVWGKVSDGVLHRGGLEAIERGSIGGGVGDYM